MISNITNRNISMILAVSSFARFVILYL